MSKFQCKCGCTLYSKCVRVSGWWRTLHGDDGTIDDTSLESLRYGDEPKTVKCAECGRSHPNPYYETHAMKLSQVVPRRR